MILAVQNDASKRWAMQQVDGGRKSERTSAWLNANSQVTLRDCHRMLHGHGQFDSVAVPTTEGHRGVAALLF